MCKISVITPVYNVEKYLKKCIDSILDQTFSDFELFIVDDGSSDLSGKIADEYAKMDNRVRVIHKQNGGAPSARNAGIKEATGEFLYFPDSDDWLEPNYLKEMYDLAVKTKAQVVISGYTMEYYENNHSQLYTVSEKEQYYSNQQMVRHNIHKYFNNMMMAVPWNKLYRTDYIHSHALEFPCVKWDDLHFNMEVIMDIESIAISSSAGYHFFRSRQGSETTIVFDKLLYSKRREQFEHILKVYDYWNIDDEEITSTIYGYYKARLVQCIQEIISSGNVQQKAMIRNLLNDELNVRAINNGKIDSIILNIIALPMKHKNLIGCILMGKLLGFFKKKTPAVFYKIKSYSINRAKKTN